METLFKDIRYGIRSLVKRPAFTAIVVITMALAIGANTAIFSLVNATLLRPLPFKDPDQLVVVWGTAPRVNQTNVSEPNFLEYQDRNHVFAHIATFNAANLTLTGGANPERVRSGRVSLDFFNVLGAQATMGRLFLPGDDQVGSNAVIVLSHRFWQHQFSSDPNIIGQTVLVEAKPYLVVGVLPAGFEFSIPGFFAPAEMWIPAVLRRDNALRGTNYLRVIARLKPGVTLREAQGELDTITQRLATEHPELGGIGTRLIPLKEQIVGQIRLMLLLLLGAVGFVLLIACANVANLQLTRASGRQKEFAIRVALGASRGRVVRQLLTESVLLSLFGGALGVALGWWAMRLLAEPGLGGFGRGTANTMDLAVITYSLLISLLTGILFGLAPALQASSAGWSSSLKEGGRTSGAGGQRLRSLLTISEIAFALVLLIGAGLLLRSFGRLLKVEPGFDIKHVLTLRLSLPRYAYPVPDKQSAFYTATLERILSLPGVKAVGAIDDLPLTADRDSETFTIQGHEPVATNQLPTAEIRSVTPHYFQALDIPLIEGRAFGKEDTNTSTPVFMINQSLARHFFPNRSPVGQRITFDSPPATLHWSTIVGVVRDVHDLGLDLTPEFEIYQPYQQYTLPYMNLVVSTDGDPHGLAASVRNEIRALDKNLPVPMPEPMESIVASSIAQRRFNMIILAVFAGIGMLLAVVGIYGVMSYAVTQRTQEIGLRMALGAQKSDVLNLILKGGMKLALIGIAIGLAAAFWLTRLMTSLLFGVTHADAVTFVTVTIVLMFVALLGCYIPARRATKVDPLVALRYE
jgi:putative ABC transport system permease protein